MVFLLIAPLGPALGQAAPRGRVVSIAGLPVAGAEVRLDGAEQSVTSDPEGWFTLPARFTGRRQLSIRAIGFRPSEVAVELHNGGLRPALFRLTPSIQRLDSLTVSEAAPVAGRLADFERRRRTGQGRYITRADLDRLRPQLVSQLFRMVPTGIRVQDSFGIPLATSQRERKLVQVDGSFYVVPCVLRTVIDGQVQPWGTSLDIVSPEEIAAIEVYLGPASIPAEFAGGRRDDFCGLVVIWTRDRR